MISSQSEFVPPPEAPIFEPTAADFEDPMLYISKIRPVAEKAGICKIRPPPGWQPPFAVDVDNFRFTPRVQRLNELEAKTRIKLNFLDQLAKFWELQGVPLKIPMVDRKCLDLYSLHKAVQDDGGYNIVHRNSKWTKIAFRLGYSDAFGSVLHQHYERILFPYDIFLAKMEGSQDSCSQKKELSEQRNFKMEAGNEDVLGQECHSKSENGIKTEEMVDKKRFDYNRNSELRKLQFFGAGPKTALPDASVVCTDEKAVAKAQSSKFTRTKTRDKRLMASLESSLCSTCGTGGNYESMLVCDGCDEVCHVYCLILPLADHQKNEWRCPKCIAKECQKPVEVYGFEQARREYTLQTFGQMADKFKIDYFSLATHMVPCSIVEKEFWRLVNCIEEDVVVEYGADIHSSECGSGFPTEKTRELFPDDDKYIRSGWNLNNIPNLSSSVLRFINVDISGMKVPWCYVGMCFSSFAWHIEDHWSSSINYLHWGEPKTWYGVPGAKAELLEECMRSNASELFEQSPDLLHQLTTIMNPNTLMQCGVPIVRTDQHAGEFVITFPRSYHSGFNQGYNFAEAVNFCAPEWLEMGRQCVDHYRLLKRQCVFSHEELICKMAGGKECLTDTMAVMVHKNLLTMIEEEKTLRKQIYDQGITEAEPEAFELLPDDERQCDYCKTTCFLSAVTCPCSGSRLVCIRHSDKLCKCPMSNLCLRYRYTLDDLLVMLDRLRVQLENFDNWAYRAKRALDSRNEERKDIVAFRSLLKEAEENRFPICPLRDSLAEICVEAEKCSAVAGRLVSKRGTKRQLEIEDVEAVVKLGRIELKEFLEEIQTLPCKIKEQSDVEDLVKKVERLEVAMRSAVRSEPPDLEQLEKLMEEGFSLDVDLPDLAHVKQAVSQIKWLEDVDVTLLGDLKWETIDRLKDIGVNLGSHPSVAKAMTRLQELISKCEPYEQKAKDCQNAKSKQPLSFVEAVIEDSRNCPLTPPSVTQLMNAVKDHDKWISEYNSLECPHLSVAEGLIARGREIPIQFDELVQLESLVQTSHAWRDQATNIFLKKKSQFTLLDILSPRGDISPNSPSNKSRRKRAGNCVYDQQDHASSNNKESVERQLCQELCAMLDLRSANRLKANPDDMESVHCVCHQKKSGSMAQCQLCNELFHVKCMLSSKHILQRDVQTTSLNFLCPSCLRSRRPSLSSLGPLLVAMAQLPLKLPEADALESLLERTVTWQDKVQEILMQPAIITLLDESNDECNTGIETVLSSGDVAANSSSTVKRKIQLPKNGSGDSGCVLSAKLLQRLEELMVEGDLLEVSVDDKEMIRSVLKKCHHANYKGQLAIFQSAYGEPGEEPTSPKVERRIVREQRKRSIERDLKAEVQSTRPKRIRKLKNQPKVEESHMTYELDEEEEDGECSADPCIRFTSNEEHVKWIQCDFCEKWFHFICIGLQTDDVSEHDDFECSLCRAGRNTSSQTNNSFSPIIKNVVSISSQESTSNSKNKFSSSDGFHPSSAAFLLKPDEVVDISDSESEDSTDSVNNRVDVKRSMDCDIIILE